MKINILGADWKIIKRRKKDDPKFNDDCEAYCDRTTHEIIAQDVVKEYAGDIQAVENLEIIYRHNLRHEIVHAFMFESGLGFNSEWAQKEELVDWIAFQASKIHAAFKAAGALDP